jgi:hypothetical protein
MSTEVGVSRQVVAEVRGLIRAGRRAAAVGARRLPRFATNPSRSGTPTVYYFSPHQPTPSGGVRNIYRHVDELNGLDIGAAVLHAKAGFRCSWFDNATRVISAGSVTLHADDVLVVPEFYGPGLDGLPAESNIVIFNQRAYDTFDYVPYEGTAAGAPYSSIKGLRGLLTVSEDNAELLRYAFDTVDTRIARLVIDPSVFHPSPGRRPRRIAFTAHRRGPEREQLLHILRSRGVLEGWELSPISGRTERETADIMRSCPLFLSFSEREGFGLPPAEAMASGCYVVGYTGLAGREYFDEEYSSPVPEADLLTFARAVERACATYEEDPDGLAKRGALASERILARYTVEGLRDDLRSFYEPLVGT